MAPQNTAMLYENETGYVLEWWTTNDTRPIRWFYGPGKEQLVESRNHLKNFEVRGFLTFDSVIDEEAT